MNPGNLSRLAVLVGMLAATCSAQEPTAKESPRPNILFAIADDENYGTAGAYGCTWVKTPGFDQVAAQGLLFTHAYTPNAKCAPSRACILTGRNSWQLEAAANHFAIFPPKFKSFFEALGAHGYEVGYTGKGWAPGIAKTDSGEPHLLTGKLFGESTLTPPTPDISDDDYAANFDNFLKTAPEGKPWCFWYGCHEPHRPYEAGSGIAKGGKKLTDIDHVPPYWPDNDIVRSDMLDYAYEVEHFDQHLSLMLADLAKRGLLKNTIVVVTSDNGMPFPRVKGQEYDSSNRLPLAIMWPGHLTKPGRTVDDYVSFIDFAPTFLELAGLKQEQTEMQPITGKSLTDVLFSDKSGKIDPARDHVLIGKERHDIGRPNDEGYPIRGIVEGEMLYLHNFKVDRWPAGDPVTGYLNCDGSPTKTFILDAHRTNPADTFWALAFGKRPEDELYNLQSDPACMHNLASDPADTATLDRLQTQLFAELKQQGDPRMLGNGDIFDQYPCSNPALRNFYERYMKGEKVKAEWANPTDFEKKPVSK